MLLASCSPLCWLALCVIGPRSHLKHTSDASAKNVQPCRKNRTFNFAASFFWSLAEIDHHAVVSFSQQQSPPGDQVSLKHQLLKVVVRVAQYRMILTGESWGAKHVFTNPRRRRFTAAFLLCSLPQITSTTSRPTPGSTRTRKVPNRQPYWPVLERERESHQRANLDFLFMASTGQLVKVALLCL